MAMSLITAKVRHKAGALRSPEDAQFRLGTTEASVVKLALERNEDVERVQRAHRNDVEVVFNFLMVVFLAICTSSVSAATLLICLRCYPSIFFFRRIPFVERKRVDKK